MKKFGLIIFILALTLGLIFANIFSFGKMTTKFFNFSINEGVSGSGNVTTEKRDVTDFQEIEVGGVFEVEVVTQKDFSVEIEADDNLLPLIKTEVSGGVLRLETEKGISTKNPIRVRISAPNIENLDISGASKVSLANLKNENLQIDSSGASKIIVAGETENLTVDVSGASKIDAENLKSENASIDASGASKVSVFVANELKSDASGASSIIYSGSPKNLIKKTSGVSSIKEK
ncbi:MAG: head GIN domain-containing protein [Pyrinomonadaceae bacterium]